MIDKAMWDALWTMAPGEMTFLCVMTVICAVGLSICVMAMLADRLGFGEEDELWEE